jgi:hypothetical protein
MNDPHLMNSSWTGGPAAMNPVYGSVLPEVTPLEADLSYPEHPIKIVDQKDRVTRHKTIKFFKIQWSNHSKEEAT